MKPEDAVSSGDISEEVTALIATLHDTQHRLEVLTEGEVDTVADRDGRTFLLRRAQEHLRHTEAAKQAAILNALPAHIALLDARGSIVSVNEAWSKFPASDAIQGPGHAVGLNYPEICESGWGDDAADCRRVAEGIRSVLSGAVLSFEIEYSNHTATQQRWFLMTVIPLQADRPNGVVVMHQDVTERKRAEEEQLAAQSKLAESEQRLRTIFETEPECVKVVSKDMELLDMNAAGLAMLDADSLAEAQAQPLVDFVVPECRAAFADLHARVMRGESGFVEFQVIGLKGGRRWLETHAAPMGGRSGKAAILLGITRDITVRKEADEQIKRSAEVLRRFSSAMDATADAIYLVDRSSMGFIHVNEAACRMQDLTRDELLALGPAALLSLPRAELERIYDSVIAGGVEAEPLEILRPRKDGSQIWVELRRHAQRSDSGWTIVTLVRDVTQRKKAALDLLESEERFRSLTKLSSDFYWETDTGHRMLHASHGPQHKPVVGGAQYGKTRWETPSTRPDAAGWAAHRAILDARTPFRDFEVSRLSAQGIERHLSLSGEPVFDKSGTFKGYRGVGKDITGRKKTDESVRRLNRVYAVLSGINSAIVRIRDRNELFRETCRIAVSEGGFVLARVIEVDLAGKARIAASTEDDSHLFQKIIDEYNSNPPDSISLLALALRTREPVFSNDVASDPRIPNRAALTAKGAYALAVLPLIVGTRLSGTITLRAKDVGAFNADENRLLLELTGNISLALEHIERTGKLDRMTRMNAMLSGINAAIVRIRTRQELFEEACRIAVEIGGMPCAWMGMANSSGKRLKLIASTGCDDGFLQSIRDRLALRNAAPEEQGLSTRAFREGRVVVINDVTVDPTISRRQAFADRGIRAVAVFPLFIAGRAVGTFVLHSEQAGFFDDDEMRLLNEVAANIAFALEHMDKETKVRRLTRVYAVLSGINTLIVRTRDRDELFREACRIAVEVGQFAKAWLGTVDPVSKKFTIVAAHGGDPLFFRRLEKEMAAKVLEGRGLALQAFDTGRPVIVNDAASDSEVLLKGDAEASDVRSLAILPLTVAGEVVAVFALNADVVGYFDDEEMTLLVELAGDISFALDHIGQEAKLDYLAYYDALTGLANRTLFLERVAQHMRGAVAGGHKLALFYLDLERFKNINDSLGRPAGDALLKEVAERLALNIKDRNLIARLGGDQFSIVLPEVAQNGDVARLLDKQIRAFADNQFRFKDAEMRLAIRVGVAIFPNDGTDAETLLRNAETAWKKAKAAGERSLFYQQRMADQQAGKLTLENQLRRALDNEEFVLHYQPKVSLESGKLTSAEALIRWNDPQTGLVPPGKFIPTLEETGLIYDVGRWALRKAVADYLRWRAAGLPAVRIAVNVSPLQLRNRGFVAEIKDVVGIDSGASAGLEIEITESVIMEDVKNSIASLQAIRALGVTIAIDDFGTGFSSLSHLARLPVDALKIDRSFVTEMTSEAKGLSLVSTIISLAHALKLKVVAEGVETEEQSRLLRLLRCDEMQGFLFSKPVPADVFEASFLAPRPLA